MSRMLALLVGLIVAAAIFTELAVRRGSRSGWRKLRAQLFTDVEAGSFERLLRARAIGMRLVVADVEDGDVEALLSFVNALLARDYALPSAAEARSAAARAESAPGLTAERQAMVGAARALLALGAGDLRAAHRHADAAVALARDHAYPWLALARVRSAEGDLAPASKAAEAALVKSPDFALALTTWAEVRIDLGDPRAAATAARAALARTPRNTRARLLLAQAELADAAAETADAAKAAEPQAARAALEAGCRKEGALSASVAAGCALHQAMRRRLDGERGESLRLARTAGAVAPPSDPRLLAMTAQVLAQLGDVDAASALVERAERVGGRDMPALVWARLAVSLGRGSAAAAPAARPSGPETRLLLARAALASGGGAALDAALGELGRAAVAADPDLESLATVASLDPSAPHAALAVAQRVAASGKGVVALYAAGLLARLAGDAHAAAEWLAPALAGHGDACRAAGEYLAATRALRRPPPTPTLLAPLRAANTRCVNLAAPADAPKRR